jgi:hypothetical protein
VGRLMGRPKSKGAYVPLAAQYFMDDAILAVGPDAELLFVRCISFLAAVPSDGFITDRQLRNIVGSGLRNVPRRIALLTEVGLLEASPGGFVVRSWTKWNRTTEEVGRLLARDRERKAQKDAADAPNSARNPDGIQSDSELQSSTEQSRAVESTTTSSDAYGADVVELCDLLANLVRANGHTVGQIGKAWHQSCERLMRLDGYTPDQIAVIIRWATAHEFWATNIRSMPKLREQFSTLRAQRNRDLAAKPAKKTKEEQIIDVLEQGRRMQEAEDRKALSA